MIEAAMMILFAVGFVLLFAGDTLVALIGAFFDGLVKLIKAWKGGE